MSAGRLFWVQRDGSIVEIPLTKPRLVIGRANDCDVRLPVPSVSSHHVAVVQDAHRVSVEDLRSTNGMRVNGRKVEHLPLKHGDQIEIGSERLVFFTDAALPAGEFNRLSKKSLAKTNAESDADVGAITQRFRSQLSMPPDNPARNFTSPPAPPPAAQDDVDVALARARAARAWITVLNGKAEGRRFPITKVTTTLGQEGMQVFQIVMRDDGYWVVRGPNSTPPFVNGASVDDTRGLRLAHNDTIELSGASVRFEVEAA